MLLDAGAPADQLGGTYGGGPNQTCLCLLVSSYHPMASGVQTDLVRVLIAGGAAPNGLLDDGAPLATALTFGYTGAARALAECGARVDNVLFAAGLGDVKAVQSFFDSDDGKLRAGSTGTYVPCIGGQEGAAAPTEPAAIVQEALHFAEWPLCAKSPEVRRSKDLSLRKQSLPMDEPRELEAPLLVPLLLV